MLRRFFMPVFCKESEALDSGSTNYRE